MMDSVDLFVFNCIAKLQIACWGFLHSYSTHKLPVKYLVTDITK